MNRLWSLLFLFVPLAATGSVVMAAYNIAPMNDLWTTENLNSGEVRIDGLIVSLHVVSAVVLMGTGLFLAWIVWRGSSRSASARYVAGNHLLEIVWTSIPAAILVWLALTQYSAWRESRIARPTTLVSGGAVPIAPSVMVVARRFGWEFHHAGADGQIDTADDVIDENQLVIPGDQDVVLELRSRDVIHNFCVPDLRLKQDVVPGLQPLVWFRTPTGHSTQIICTELCGWGHYLMQARLQAVSQAEYESYLARNRELPNSEVVK